MASSARNDLKARLKASTHSRAESRQGLAGRDRCRPRAPPNSAFAALAGEEAHRRADPAREEEAGAERAGGDDRQPRAQLAGDVRGLAEAVAQLLDRRRELAALGLDLAADGRRACGR